MNGAREDVLRLLRARVKNRLTLGETTCEAKAYRLIVRTLSSLRQRGVERIRTILEVITTAACIVRSAEIALS